KHLSDLQAFAEKARNSIERVAVSIDLSNPIGRYFRSHYPDVAAKVDKWNQIDLGPKDRDFWKVMQREETRLGLAGNGTGMLAALAEGDIEFDQLAWTLENDF